MGRVARYVITVTVDRPIRLEDWDIDYSEEENLSTYTEAATLRDLEKDIYKALRPIDGDTDCEVISATIELE